MTRTGRRGAHDRPHTLHGPQTSYTNLPIIVAVMLILNQWRRSLRILACVSCKFALYNLELRARKTTREGRRENHRAVETRPACGQHRERERERRGQRMEGERETRISNNRVSTIKANPPATLIMVCRIDLSRSPAQTARPNGILLPVSAPSFERSIILRENWYPWKALYGGGGGGFTTVLRPRFRLSRETCATSMPITG